MCYTPAPWPALALAQAASGTTFKFKLCCHGLTVCQCQCVQSLALVSQRLRGDWCFQVCRDDSEVHKDQVPDLPYLNAITWASHEFHCQWHHNLNPTAHDPPSIMTCPAVKLAALTHAYTSGGGFQLSSGSRLRIPPINQVPAKLRDAYCNLLCVLYPKLGSSGPPTAAALAELTRGEGGLENSRATLPVAQRRHIVERDCRAPGTATAA